VSLAVVVATRNSSRTVGKCLASVCAQREINQVIVVDGSSRDNTLEIARAFHVEICTEHGRGFFGAYDLGFSRAASDFVMFLDSDAYIRGFDFRSAMNLFDDPRVGLVVCPAEAPTTNWVGRIQAEIWAWRNSRLNAYTGREGRKGWRDRQYAKFFMSKEMHSGATTTGPCYIMRSEAIRKMGGMHPRGDDFALARMLRGADYGYAFHVSQSVWHIPRTSLTKLFREYCHFGLRGAQISRNFFTKRERAVGIFMFSLSFAAIPYIAWSSRNPVHLFVTPLLRAMQALGFIVGTLSLVDNPERNYNAY
jgi:glycosyltransferase involved in cell wall biosynthesis